MKKSYLLFAGLTALLLGSCGPTDVLPESLIVTSSGNINTINIAETLQLDVHFTPSNTTKKEILWSTEDSAIASVDDRGLVTGAGVGSVKIYATSKEVTTVSNFITINVQKDPDVVYPETIGISAAGNKTQIEVDETLQFTASVGPAAVVDKSVTWSVSDPEKASIDANGLLTALKAGTIDVIASANALPSKTATRSLTIVEEAGPVMPETISVTSTGGVKTVVIDGTLQLTASVSPANAENKNVNWSTSDASKATVDANGLVTGKAVGSVTITATTAVPGLNVKGSIDLTVAAPVVPTPEVTLEELFTNPETYKGKKVETSGVVTACVGWYFYIQDGDYAIRVANADEYYPFAGVVVVVSGTFTWQEFTQSYYLSASTYLPQGYGVMPTPMLVDPSEWTAESNFLPDKYTYHLVKLENLVYEGWSVTNECGFAKFGTKNIAIDVDGDLQGTGADAVLVKLVNMTAGTIFDFIGVTGRHQVSGIDRNFLDFTDISQVIVKEVGSVPVTSITPGKTTESLTEGQTAQISTVVKPDNATDKTLSYASSNQGVATVSATGEISAIAAGTSVITISAAAPSTVTATVNVTVVSAASGIDNYRIWFEEDFTESLSSSWGPATLSDVLGNSFSFSSVRNYGGGTSYNAVQIGYDSSEAAPTIDGKLVEGLGTEYDSERAYISVIANINFKGHSTAKFYWDWCANTSGMMYLLETIDGGNSWTLVNQVSALTLSGTFRPGTVSYTRTKNQDVCRYAFVFSPRGTMNTLQFCSNSNTDNFVVTA